MGTPSAWPLETEPLISVQRAARAAAQEGGGKRKGHGVEVGPWPYGKVSLLSVLRNLDLSLIVRLKPFFGQGRTPAGFPEPS